MTPDINIRDYYLKFIYNAKIDISRNKKELEVINDLKSNVLEYIIKHENIIKNEFNIDIENIKNNYDSIKDTINKLLKEENIKHKIVLLQIAKFGSCLEKENKCNKLIELANRRKDIKFRQFQSYVHKYYSKVHKCVLEGMGYKYGYGIGTYCCNYWRLSNSGLKKQVLDFAATRKKKKELIEKGIKIYDDNEAAWYKARNIPYDGVDYRVYTNKTHYYEFTFVNSRISITVPYNYNRTEYANTKYKKMSQQEIANTYCKTIDDIYDLQVDIKCKLNILLYKDPTKYLNFIRNVEQDKYKHRAYNSENRQ